MKRIVKNGMTGGKKWKKKLKEKEKGKNMKKDYENPEEGK